MTINIHTCMYIYAELDCNGIIKSLKGATKTTCTKKTYSERQAATTKIEKPKRPVISQNQLVVPAGEDQISFARHNRLLNIEFSRTKRNETLAKELIKMSYEMRRNDILENGHTINVLEKYPFLQTLEHVSNEYNLLAITLMYTTYIYIIVNG